MPVNWQLLLGSIIASIVFAIILFPIFRSVSNLLTKLGTYHRKEKTTKRLFLLWRTYLLLSVPMLFISLISLKMTFGMLPLFELLALSLGMSLMIPLFGRIASLGCALPPRDVEEAIRTKKVSLERICWKRENERVLSFLYALICGALIMSIAMVVYFMVFQKEPLLIEVELSQTEILTSVCLFLSLPLITALVGEGTLYVFKIPEHLKI